MEWAIEVCKEFDKPIVATMCIGPMGDMRDVSAGECAVRMSRKVQRCAASHSPYFVKPF